MADEHKRLAKHGSWRGDDHKLEVQGAAEVGLDRTEAEIDSYTRGFKEGIVIQDAFDGAIVARGRTVLREAELARALRPALQYLGVARDDYKVSVHDGSFELRVSKKIADASNPSLDSAKLALQLLIGFGLTGGALYQFVAPFLAAIVWGIGLMLAGWQLRRGVASGRAMLSARLALALGMLAREQQLILPPEGRT
jgi:hypothetical protein